MALPRCDAWVSAKQPSSRLHSMSAQIIDGVALSAILREALKREVAALAPAGFQPGLAVILAGEDPASKVYVRNKIKACAEVGIRSELYEFPVHVSEAAVLDCIRALNAATHIHGILVQLPLPRQVDEGKV
ncbi:MAG: bifunctional 5,10-methylene-tetrahydrofolate dehydrogenase/5,10-methylene-tetrahydrofolate cyclohydrolase, partial [Burkholderiales bacterium]|nr:bifunctional 5,10-methylene-tetrahydrofolate dehydrogenase/5,10-methylene-tetrahydrofolate cyclohydrolase [Burkholderiales bacterium]